MSKENPLNLGFLVSHHGTGNTFKSVFEATKSGELEAQIAIVLSDHPDIPVITWELIKRYNLLYDVMVLQDRKSAVSRDTYSGELVEMLNEWDIDVAIMDGFSTILTRPFFEKLHGSLLNIHPGLVPDNRDEPFIFPDGTEAPWNQGLLKDKAVVNFLGGKYAGATVHIATEEPDFGPVLVRRIIEVIPGDTVETLYPRIKLAEGEALLTTLRKLALEKNQ